MLTAKGMLLDKMIPRFPDKNRDTLELEIAQMTWNERMERYGKYCVEDALHPTFVINGEFTGIGSSGILIAGLETTNASR
jgi:hypothetical protein